MGNARAGGTQTNFGHRVFELQAVFGFVDGFGRGANQFDFVFIEHPVVPQVQGAVERGLSTHGGQYRIGALFGNDLFNGLPSDRLNVGDVGRGGVGHDRRGIAVDQDDFVALFAQCLAGLYARIIEFAGLANDDGASPDDQNTFEVGTLRHQCVSIAWMKRSKR